MKNCIIGISGQLNSGKDTVASMINYVLNVGIARAKYDQWAIKQLSHDNSAARRITHFADPMKDCLSTMFGIPRHLFDDREYKDNKYYVVSDGYFIDEKKFNYGGFAHVDINCLRNNTLDFFMDMYSKREDNTKVVIKLRTLMKYFGTNIGKDMLWQKLWIRSTIVNAVNIIEANDTCIIPDVNYFDEWNAIKQHPLYGGDIIIVRDKLVEADHSSEDMDFKCTTTIENNGTKLQLFYKVLNFLYAFGR